MPGLPPVVTEHLKPSDYATALTDARSMIFGEFRTCEQNLSRPAMNKGVGFSRRMDALRALQAAVTAGALEVLRQAIARQRGATNDFDAVLARVIKLLEPPPTPPPAADPKDLAEMP